MHLTKSSFSSWTEKGTPTAEPTAEGCMAALNKQTARPEARGTLHVRLLSGRDLMARDDDGTSDPYVNVHLGGQVMYDRHDVWSRDV